MDMQLKLIPLIANLSQILDRINEDLISKEEVVKIYSKLYVSLGIVKIKDLINEGIKRSTIKALFNNIDEIDTEARGLYPNKFKDMRLSSIYSKQYMNSLRLSIKNKSIKRFFISTVVTGCDVDKNFYNSIKTFCKKEKAMFLGMLSTDPASRRAKSQSKIDKILDNMLKKLDITHNRIKGREYNTLTEFKQ